VACPYSGALFSDKKERSTDICYYMMAFEDIMLKKEVIHKILYTM
jgi:hypothetical protein